MRCYNPFAFRPGPVSFWTTVIYVALLVPLVVINESVPPPPASPTAYRGLNLTEAWLDLSTLTASYHPYASHENDKVRGWLLLRIGEILDQNGASWSTEATGPAAATAAVGQAPFRPREFQDDDSTGPHVVVFNDLLSNLTLASRASPATKPGSENEPRIAAYFEGTNVLVYVRGTEDEQGEWWKSAETKPPRVIGKGGVLVNAHYDSVATGYGATDNGMGVISALQLVRYFTTPGHQPRKGVVIMFNNAEEDFLYGARVFGQSPLLPFIHTFLNLEGAGAGGRAILFRSTDQETTSAYSHVEHPFGTVVGSDGFSMGLIRSQTDYVVLHDTFGERGLDLAFYRPRARYHTSQDDARHASRASLWHMLSAAVTTTVNLASDTSDAFIGPRPDGERNKVQNGRGSDGVWFDLFGEGFVLFNLRGMFAWSLTLLVAAPLILMLLFYVIHRSDKDYFFSPTVKPYDGPDSERVPLGGLRGIFRFPLALVVAGALVFGAAFLLKKINPLIIYSSEYAVWAMMLSLFYFVFWAIVRGANFARPSALARGYVHIWLFVLGWIVLAAVTVSEDRMRIASGYLFVFWQSAIFLSTFISLCEMFALPKKQSFGTDLAREDHEIHRHREVVPHADALIAPGPGEVDNGVAPDGDGGGDGEDVDDDDDDVEPPTESTPLVRGTSRGNARTTFATTYRRSVGAIMDSVRSGGGEAKDGHEPFGDEQAWSGNMPRWTWLLQFLLLAPFMIVITGQLGLLLTDAVNQTGPDGSDLLIPYLIVALSSILLLVPMTPFIHRVTHHVPLFLLVIFTGTLIYNLTAFPFSESARYKAYWQQTIDLDTGASQVKLAGLAEYIRPIIAELPSSAGKTVECSSNGPRQGQSLCTYDGSDVPPNVAGGDDAPGGGIPPPQKGYADLVSVNTTRTGPSSARLAVAAKNTRGCFLRFTKPVSRVEVLGGSGWDERFGPFPDGGVTDVKLWRRDWDKVWEVDVGWDGGEERGGLEGRAVCIWSDANERGNIPALDEALQYAPAWASITKMAEGLVEGSKRFSV